MKSTGAVPGADLRGAHSAHAGGISGGDGGAEQLPGRRLFSSGWDGNGMGMP